MGKETDDFEERGLRIESKEGNVVHEMKPAKKLIREDFPDGPDGDESWKKFGPEGMETK